MTPKDPGTKTGTKLLRTIAELDERGETGVTELANRLDIAKSTAHYHLSTLREEGFVYKEGDRYRLSLRFLGIGDRIRRRTPVYEAAKEKVDELAEKTGELAVLMVEERGRGVHLYKAMGENAIIVEALTGNFVPLHNRAAGKAILAHMERARVEQTIERHGLSGTTNETITDPGQLFDELERIRDAEIAFNREESTAGLHGVAVPIFDTDQKVLASISIAGPSKRIEGTTFTDEYPILLSQARNVIELNINYSTDS